jgi:hypothetical protein
MYRAAAALPFDDRDRVTAGLRGQLQVMAAAAGADPDWSTLRVDGPARRSEQHGAGLSEWTATVVVSAGAHDLSDPSIDALLAKAVRSATTTAQETSPLTLR